jgi:hypothetical protein
MSPMGAEERHGEYEHGRYEVAEDAYEHAGGGAVARNGRLAWAAPVAANAPISAYPTRKVANGAGRGSRFDRAPPCPVTQTQRR